MSERAEPAPPSAESRRTFWPGLVWAIPLSALIVVVFMALHAVANRGVDAVVTFDTADGLKVGDTKVLYQGYEAGHVVKLDVDKATRRIEVTVRLDHRARPILNTGTVFYLIGAGGDLDNLASVKAAFTGPAIGIAPSFQGAPTDHFHGLNEEPAVLPGTKGAAFTLHADRLGTVKARSAVIFRGQVIGKVTGTSVDGLDGFRVGIFVYKPFLPLVRAGATFWPAEALQISAGAGQIGAELESLSALLSGAIEMDAPADAPPLASPAGSQFTLYDSRSAAESGPPGPSLTYAMSFPGTGGGLAKGAPVTLAGFEVGSVISRTLQFDPATDQAYSKVVVGLEPQRLRVQGPEGSSDPQAWRADSDAAVGRLVAHGYRARLSQAPPLLGAFGVELTRTKSRSVATLGQGEPPVIPTLGGSSDLAGEAQDILAKVDAVPIRQIGQQAADITGRVRAIVSSPQLTGSLDHLHNTLKQADDILAQAKPQVGPLVAKLREAADQAAGAAGAAKSLLTGQGADSDASLPRAIQELSDTAASIRALSDYLGRHPEALLKGKGDAR